MKPGPSRHIIPVDTLCDLLGPEREHLLNDRSSAARRCSLLRPDGALATVRVPMRPAATSRLWFGEVPENDAVAARPAGTCAVRSVD